MDKQYLKQVLMYVSVAVVAIAMMVYFGYHMISNFTADIETQPAYIDSFSESVTGDAYILREEEVLYSNSRGVVNYLVPDGAKVAVGDAVADVYRIGGEDVRERIDEIDAEIERLTEVESQAKYLSVSDVNRIDSEIAELVLTARTQAADNDLSSAAATAEEIRLLMDIRRIVIGELESYEAKIGELRAERQSVVAQLSDIAETLKSKHSAYYFYDVDGYESAFSFESIDSLTLADIDAMVSAEPSALTGYETGKLVFDYNWYVAVPTDKASLQFFTVGKSYTLEFGAATANIQMKLYSVVTDTGGQTDKACLIFTTSDMPDGFGYSRMQPVSIDVKTYEGYKVPLSAVRAVDYDGVTVEGVYVLYGNTVAFRRIDIILRQDGYVLCRTETEDEEEDDGGYVDFPIIDETEAETEPPEEYELIPFLQMYDLVITSAKGLYEGKIIAD